MESILKLFLENSVCIFGFLLLLKLCSVFRKFFTPLRISVHTRGIVFLLEILVRTVDRIFEFSCNFGSWTCIPGHSYLLFDVNLFSVITPVAALQTIMKG